MLGEGGLQRDFALKLNKYLPSLEKVFQQYAIEASSRLGLNNFIRFLKEYRLLKGAAGEAASENTKLKGEITVMKKGTGVLWEYKRVSTEKAQIVFRQTVKQAAAKLNFE